MYILELIIALQANDFSIPKRDVVSEAVSKAHQCQLALEYREECANILQKLVDTKYKLGGIYANYQ
jgi:hypothetical protein